MTKWIMPPEWAEQERVCKLLARERALNARERTRALVTIAAQVRRRTPGGMEVNFVENFYPIVNDEQKEASFFPWYTFVVFAATTHGLVIYDRRDRSWRTPVTSLDGYPTARIRVALADADRLAVAHDPLGDVAPHLHDLRHRAVVGEHGGGVDLVHGLLHRVEPAHVEEGLLLAGEGGVGQVLGGGGGAHREAGLGVAARQGGEGSADGGLQVGREGLGLDPAADLGAGGGQGAHVFRVQRVQAGLDAGRQAVEGQDQLPGVEPSTPPRGCCCLPHN